jgi:hypothetical protein
MDATWVQQGYLSGNGRTFPCVTTGAVPALDLANTSAGREPFRPLGLIPTYIQGVRGEIKVRYICACSLVGRVLHVCNFSTSLWCHNLFILETVERCHQHWRRLNGNHPAWYTSHKIMRTYLRTFKCWGSMEVVISIPDFHSTLVYSNSQIG